MQEIPTMEHLKKIRFDLYEHRKCPMCKQVDEDFYHVFTCSNSYIKTIDIMHQSQKLLIKLLYDHANYKVDHLTFSNIPNIWSLQPISTDLNFIDLIKGIVSQVLFDKVNHFTKNVTMTSLIISIF